MGPFHPFSITSYQRVNGWKSYNKPSKVYCNFAKLQVSGGSVWPSFCYEKNMPYLDQRDLWLPALLLISTQTPKKKTSQNQYIIYSMFSAVFMWSTGVFLALLRLLRPWHLSRLVSPRSWETSELRLGVPGQLSSNLGPYSYPKLSRLLQRRHNKYSIVQLLLANLFHWGDHLRSLQQKETCSNDDLRDSWSWVLASNYDNRPS